MAEDPLIHGGMNATWFSTHSSKISSLDGLREFATVDGILNDMLAREDADEGTDRIRLRG